MLPLHPPFGPRPSIVHNGLCSRQRPAHLLCSDQHGWEGLWSLQPLNELLGEVEAVVSGQVIVTSKPLAAQLFQQIRNFLLSHWRWSQALGLLVVEALHLLWLTADYSTAAGIIPCVLEVVVSNFDSIDLHACMVYRKLCLLEEGPIQPRCGRIYVVDVHIHILRQACCRAGLIIGIILPSALNTVIPRTVSVQLLKQSCLCGWRRIGCFICLRRISWTI
mmetsp:Transcript_26402/g.48266  ORF Transcript_26402/g.48266 Transcript_26402/m.48266 type:complete len:220 (-) Transcript_26402:71-730(-)